MLFKNNELAVVVIEVIWKLGLIVFNQPFRVFNVSLDPFMCVFMIVVQVFYTVLFT